MEPLNHTEEQIMQILWQLERAFVKDILEKMDDPKPPYTTVSSIVRNLETKGYVGHKAYGKTHEYIPQVSREEYGKGSLQKMLKNYFNDRTSNLLSLLMKERDLDNEEIRELQQLIDAKKKQP
ncbi:BlaI/MecI/CopY family transcriptional regulator [uncultured Chitinophaga sp.]|uniref:BlaI/MecI/CopY family transcriptional regulator n=1 Tax=uncultured Chitinophaga sp. TaxID=339340 RepID=UPI0025CFBA03|nr:BlaI/MecI/CopY family transcriptional regulator [uncultured Chitinophaga sp.]